MLYRVGKGLAGPDQDQDPFGSCNTCIDQVPLQHDEMVHHNRHDNDGEFRPLGLMNGRRVSQDQLIQLRRVIIDGPPVEGNRQGLFLHIDRLNKSDIPVKDLFVIIVADLHDLVPGPVQIPASFETAAARIDGFLQGLVEVGRPDHAPLHGGQDLDLNRRHLIVGRELAADQVDNGGKGRFRILLLHEEKVRIPSVGQIGHFARVDPVGVQDDPALPGLPEDPGQPDDRKAA